MHGLWWRGGGLTCTDAWGWALPELPFLGEEGGEVHLEAESPRRDSRRGTGWRQAGPGPRVRRCCSLAEAPPEGPPPGAGRLPCMPAWAGA